MGVAGILPVPDIDDDVVPGCRLSGGRVQVYPVLRVALGDAGHPVHGDLGKEMVGCGSRGLYRRPARATHRRADDHRRKVLAHRDVADGDKVDSPSVQFLQIVGECHEVPKRQVIRREFDQNIHVAVGPPLAAGGGPEDPDLYHTKPLPEYR